MRKIYEFRGKQNNVSLILEGKSGNRVRYDFRGGSVIANVLPTFQTENAYYQQLLEESDLMKKGVVKLRQVVNTAPVKQPEPHPNGDLTLVSGVTSARQAMEWVANTLGVRVTSGRDAVEMARKNGYRFEGFK